MSVSVRIDRLPLVEATIGGRMSLDDGMDAQTRKLHSARYLDAVPKLRPSMVCEARVVSSRLVRYKLTAFSWLTGTPWPTAIFTSMAEAEAWARRSLANDQQRGGSVST